ncbi:IS66 family insertion sequence element accessory protein TnpB [Anaerotruncus rubiinfantis]|uniref:IS66 family insertion sequence element accessory protein TnpB n=1 Tax=Anaerotruncus rubiinfantis TaxID=1720200 RepID=UPI000833F9D3|nr:IS66 family insertion sequence element accessory protein TnpB [Anaerotruncus rubiinfantis]
MLNNFTGADKVYIACGYTNLRRGIDGLATIVQQQFQLDPFTNTLFLFCRKRRDRIKGAYWEGDGFLLLYKRLEQGSYQWPRKENEVKSLTVQHEQCFRTSKGNIL